MNSIDIEDLATLLVSEFVKQNKAALTKLELDYLGAPPKVVIPFLKMSFERRKKLVAKVLDKIMSPTKEEKEVDENDGGGWK